jgi:hypothetical protein
MLVFKETLKHPQKRQTGITVIVPIQAWVFDSLIVCGTIVQKLFEVQ